MNDVVLSPISLKEFETLIRNCVKDELQNLPSSAPQETEYITRREAAAILGVSLPTLNDWSKRGILTSYTIGTRVRYKKAEVENSLTQVQSLKYKRGE